MSKNLRNDYLLLLITLLSLVGGLLQPSESLGAILTFAAGAAVGFVLSMALLIRAIRLGEFGSDALALVAIAATALTSEWIAASVISVMLATGRALERWAEGRARNQLEALLARAPRSAHVFDTDGNPTDVSLSKVTLGSKILVRSGEVVPLDGTLVASGTFDESALTGEPLPQFVAAGEEVPSGVVNAASNVELITTKTEATSTYSALVRLVEQAQAASANGVRVANKWAVRFVPFAILLAAATWLITGDYAKAVAVIVAATPCPLILAVPVAIIAGMSKAASKGAIIKGGAALEALARTKTVLVDKTGTLTHGGPEVSQVAFAPGVNQQQTFRLAASLEQASPHVVAKSILAEAQRRNLMLQMASNTNETHGAGLTGEVEGHSVRVGQLQSALPEWAPLTNALIVAIEIDGQLQAVIGLDDPLRDDAKGTIALLRKLGVQRIIMVSGDRKSTADAVGLEVGVDEVFAECTPERKLEIVHAEMLATKGSVVAVGDGINDAPALAAADVSFAIGAGSDAAVEAADLTLIRSDLGSVVDAIELSRATLGKIRQNLFFAFIYNVLGIPLAAFGMLNPVFAGAAMAMSSVSVVSNSLLLKRWRPRGR